MEKRWTQYFMDLETGEILSAKEAAQVAKEKYDIDDTNVFGFWNYFDEVWIEEE